MKKYLSLVLFVAALVACEKNSTSVFSGITETDEYGELIGSIDETDWQLDDAWSAKEEAIFKASDISLDNSIIEVLELKQSAAIGPSNSYNGKVKPAYANPCNGEVSFSINIDAKSKKFAVVDQNFDVVLSPRESENNNIINFSSSSSGMRYRIYYLIENHNGDIQKGHGDIQVN